MPQFVPIEELFKGRHFDQEIVILTCPGFLYQSEFGKARFLYYWSPSHPAGAARREPCSSTAARRLQGRDAVAA